MKNAKLIEFCEDHHYSLERMWFFGIFLGVVTCGIGLLLVVLISLLSRCSALTEDRMVEMLALLTTDEEKRIVKDAVCRRNGKFLTKDLDPLLAHVRAVAERAHAAHVESVLGACTA